MLRTDGRRVLPQTHTSQQQFSPASSPVFANAHRLTGDGVAHAHDFLELAVIAHGTCLHVSAAGEVPASCGSVFVLRPGAWHWYIDCSDMVVVNCCLTAQAMRSEFAFLRALPDVQRLLWTGPMRTGLQGVLATTVPPSAASDVVHEVLALQQLLADGCENRTLLVGRLLTALGVLVDQADLAPITGAGPPVSVLRVVRVLDAEPERAWTLDDLAVEASLAPTYLSRIFHQHIGLPPLAYLARLRVERAAVLLAQTDLSVGRVAAAVGWPDPNYFTRRFRSLSGMSPSAYRDRIRSGMAGLTNLEPLDHVPATSG